MVKEQSSRKRNFDETNLFCKILADPENNSMETLEKSALKTFSSEVSDFIIAEFKEGLEKCSALRQKFKKPESKKEREQIGGQSRGVSLKNLVNQKYNDNPFLN